MSESKIHSRTVREARSLPHRLSTEEKLVRAQQLSAAVRENYDIEAEKKCANAEFKERLEEVGSRISKLSRVVADGVEYRETEVEVFFDYDLGMVRFTRTDTGEVIESRGMTPSERQTRMEI